MPATTAANQVKDFMIIDQQALNIRKATAQDVPAITHIYNDAVLHTNATFDTEPKTEANRLEWLLQHGDTHPVIVADLQGEVLGWASVNRWSDRAAYDGTAEVSVYIHPQYKGKGLGSLLLPALVEAAKQAKLHYLLARITQGNDTSIRLHERNGFNTVGVMHEVGFKFGKFLDVTIMERILND